MDNATRFLWFALGISAGALLAMCAPARSQEVPQQACTALAQIEQNLAAQYGEVRYWTGTTEKGQEMRLYTSITATNTWTVVAVHGEQGCVLSSGKDSKIGNKPMPGLSS
jgi:hypothetical protein